MIKELQDKNSGAILFKQDEDGERIEKLEKAVESLTKEVNKLKSKIKELTK